MVALAAVSYVPKGEKKPALGTLNIEADTQVSLEQRLVKFTTLKITEANFQKLSSSRYVRATTDQCEKPTRIVVKTTPKLLIEPGLLLQDRNRIDFR